MTDFRWLIEAPGQRYLAARKLGNHEFYWTQDHNKAIMLIRLAHTPTTFRSAP